MASGVVDIKIKCFLLYCNTAIFHVQDEVHVEIYFLTFS